MVGVGIFLLRYVCSDFDGLLLVLFFFGGGWGWPMFMSFSGFYVFFSDFDAVLLGLDLFCLFFRFDVGPVFFLCVCVFDVMGFC